MLLVTFGVMQFLLISWICYFEFRNKSSVVFLWGTLLIIYGVMHIFASFIGDINYDDAILLDASVFVVLFCCFYICTRILITDYVFIMQMHHKMLSSTLIEKQNANYMQYVFILLALVILGRMLIINYASGGILNSSWGGIREYQTTVSYMNCGQILNVLFFVLSGILLIFLILRKRILALATVFLLIINVLITRNRIEVLPLICPFISLFIFKTKKVNINTILWLIIIGISTIFIIYGLRAYRYYGSVANFFINFNGSDFINQIQEFIKTNNGELGLRRYFYYFIEHNNNFVGFGKGASYIRMLLVFIPTKWSVGIKPNDFAITMGTAVGMGPGGSMHPTLFGDCYANLGWWGIFLGIFWAIYATLFDKLITSRKNITSSCLIYSLNASMFCMVGRGAVYNAFAIVAWGTLVIVLFDICFTRIKFTIKRRLDCSNIDDMQKVRKNRL